MNVHTFQRIVRRAGIGLLPLLLSGCVYVNLLKTQKQLAQFNRFFLLQDTGRLTLQSLAPTLRPTDVYWLMDAEPTSVTTNLQTINARYILAKQGSLPPNDSSGRLAVDLVFRDQLLRDMSFPTNWPAPALNKMMTLSLKSLGQAKFNALTQTAFLILPMKAADMPTQEKMIHLLGEPFLREQTGPEAHCQYRYRLLPADGHRAKGSAVNEMVLEVWLTSNVVQRSSLQCGRVKCRTQVVPIKP